MTLVEFPRNRSLCEMGLIRLQLARAHNEAVDCKNNRV